MKVEQVNYKIEIINQPNFTTFSGLLSPDSGAIHRENLTGAQENA
jgi:hypothetical protein